MAYYKYCGSTIESNIPLPELPNAKHNREQLFFILEEPINRLRERLWLHHWFSPVGEIVLSYSLEDFAHLLHFPGLADFRISANAKEVHCYPQPGLPRETIRHLLLDQVLPRCLAYQGRILVHASAVEFEGRLIVFIGESGTGKSTLAGNFHQAGQTVVSDDCLRIQESNGQIVAVPSYGGLRLWEDSLQALFSAKQNTYSMAHYTTKKRVQVTENDIVKFGNDLPILAVIVLSSPGTISLSEVTLDRLSHREAFIAMLKQTFQLNVMDLERMTRHMRVLGQIVPKLPAYRMSMPHDYALLPLARQKILEAVV